MNLELERRVEDLVRHYRNAYYGVETVNPASFKIELLELSSLLQEPARDKEDF